MSNSIIFNESEFKLHKNEPGFKGYGKSGMGIDKFDHLLEELGIKKLKNYEEYKDVVRDTYFVKMEGNNYKAFGEGLLSQGYITVRTRKKKSHQKQSDGLFKELPEMLKIKIKKEREIDKGEITRKIYEKTVVDKSKADDLENEVAMAIIDFTKIEPELKNCYTEDCKNEIKEMLRPLFTIFNYRRQYTFVALATGGGIESERKCKICFDEFFYVYGDGTDESKIYEDITAINREHSKYYHEIQLEISNNESDKEIKEIKDFDWAKNLIKKLEGDFKYLADGLSRFERGKKWLIHAKEGISIYDLKYSRKGQIASHLSEIFQDCGCGYQSGLTWSDAVDGSYRLNKVRRDLRAEKDIAKKLDIIVEFKKSIKKDEENGEFDNLSEDVKEFMRCLVSEDNEERKRLYTLMDLPYFENKIYGLHKMKMDTDKLLLLYFEFTGTKRTRYSREFDRIVLTTAFRHLQYKTQVMINSASDDQRTRLLHSIEVQKIAKTLALQLGANWELAEAMGIGHDVGHAPFGHSGEYALDQCLKKHYFGGFAHALQSVKVLNHIEPHELRERYGLYGIGLSKHVLEGILKHDADAVVSDLGSPEYQLQYYCPELWDIGNTDVNNDGDKIKLGGLEAQIVYWADKIAYLGHDWEEFSGCEGSDRLDKMAHRISEMYALMRHIINNASVLGDSNEREWEFIKEFLARIDTIQNNIRDGIYTSLTDEWLHELQNLIIFIKENGPYKEDDLDNSAYPLRYFTLREYACLYNYLKVTRAWIHLTGERPTMSYLQDFVYVIRDYLKKVDTRIITTAVQDKIIGETLRRIKELRFEKMAKGNNDSFFDEADFRQKSNELWDDASKSLKENNTKERKKAYRKNLLVSMHGDYLDDVEFAMDFTRDHYIKTTQVGFMNQQEEKIIEQLFDYYMKNRKMLPFEERNRLVRELTLHEARYYIIMTNYYKGIFSKFYKKFDEDYKKDMEDINKINKSYSDLCACKDENPNENDLDKAKKGYNDMKDTINSFASAIEKKIETESTKDYIVFSKEVYGYKAKDIVHARIVADYIASMTDRMAIKKYQEITGEKTAWSTHYSE